MSILTPLRIHRRRWLIAMLVMICVGAIAFVRATRRATRAERLLAEIKQTDGWIRPGMSIWERIGQVVKGHANDSGTTVKLPSHIDREWLESRDYLVDLPIGNLQFDDGVAVGALAAPLAARHPLVLIYARGAANADLIAAALAGKRTLTNVYFSGSDLTDTGFQQLPLEQVQYLEIAETRVTAAGLQELRRAQQLRHLCLGQRQVSPEALSRLQQIEHPFSLGLKGPDVTDETLATLTAALKGSSTHKLEEVYVDRTSVTNAGIDAWNRALPSIPLKQPLTKLPPALRPNIPQRRFPVVPRTSSVL